MRNSTLSIALALLASPVLASSSGWVIKDTNPDKSTVFRQISHKPTIKPEQKRTTDFPTHVIHMSRDISAYNIGCFEAFDTIFDVINLDNDEITFQFGAICSTSTEQRAQQLSFYISMDPATDKGINDLQQFITKYSGADIYGEPMNIETVKGVVVVLEMNAGIQTEGDEGDSSLHPSAWTDNGLYFNNLYAMDNGLITDISGKLGTNNPELVNSFLSQWTRPEEVSSFAESLFSSNYIQIEPKTVFLMDSGASVYKPLFSYNIVLDCREYPSGMCLG